MIGDHVIGCEINGEAEHQSEADTTLVPEMPLGQRGAKMVDTPAFEARVLRHPIGLGP